jgi:hypothetical protein
MGKHYVPQEYLRGFATDSDLTHVWLFDKKTHRWSHAAITKVAQEADYYTPEDEFRLATEVEKPGHRALDKLRKREELSADERDDVVYYAAAFLTRVPRRRRKGRELFPQILQSNMSETRAELSRLTTDKNAGRVSAVLHQLERIERDYERKIPNAILSQLAEPWPTEAMVAAIQKMTWRLVDVPSGSFLFATDNPATFFDSYGVGSELSELTMPLSSNRALLGSYQGTPSGTVNVTAKSTVVKEINRRMASSAERFLFSPRRASWIETLATRKNPFLSRILW